MGGVECSHSFCCFINLKETCKHRHNKINTTSFKHASNLCLNMDETKMRIENKEKSRFIISVQV
jgi:hypothetical protein